MATGDPLWGNPEFTVKPGKVMLLDKEIGEDMLAVRCFKFFGALSEEKLGLANQNFVATSGNPKFKFDRPGASGVLRDEVDRHRPNVIIVDPVSRFMDGSDSSNDDVARFIETLEVVRDAFPELGLSYVLIHHFKKPEHDYKGEVVDELSAYNFRGASRWIDDASALVTMVRREVSGDDHWKLSCRTRVRNGRGPGDFVLNVRPDSGQPVTYVPDGTSVSTAGTKFRGGKA